MAERDRTFRLAVAIDFGTSRSGYAYQFVEDKEPNYRNVWPGDDNLNYPKTLTHLLYSPDATVEAWGHLAMQKHTELRAQRREEGYLFFEKFKMLLHEGKHRDDEGLYIITNDNTKFYVVRLIADYLRLLKEVALKDIQDGLGGEGLVSENDIRWCLTIPAIWSDESKQIMRRAAQESGLIGDGSEEAERLLLVLEPEAAAVHCHEVMRKREELSELSSGTRIMVVDAGGGTLDITAHEVIKGGGLKEIIPGTGGPYGSTYVDKDFREYLNNKFSPEAMEKFEAEWPVDYLKMMNKDWEGVKRGYNPEQDNVTFFEIPRRLFKILENDYRQVLEKLADEQEGEDAAICLDSKTIEAIFKPTLDKLVAKVEEMFQSLGGCGCDVIFLVGGFSESPLLRKRIKEQFENKVKSIVMPPRPGAAILLGAASFGIKPDDLIRFRRARLTYGTDCAMAFESGIDPESRRIPKEYLEEDYDGCTGRFDIYVASGDIVPVDAGMRRIYTISSTTEEATIGFYATSKKNVRYADEEGVQEIGSLSIQVPFVKSDSSKRKLIVTVFFGRSEITASVEDPITENIERANFRFSSTYSPEQIGD